MAFSMGNGGSGRSRFRGMNSLAEINIVPLVDVVMVLLVIFMLTAHVMEFGMEVDVPKVNQVRDTARELPVITITKDGYLFLNDKEVNINEVGPAVQAALRQRYRGLRAGRQGRHLGRDGAGGECAQRRRKSRSTWLRNLWMKPAKAAGGAERHVWPGRYSRTA